MQDHVVFESQVLLNMLEELNIDRVHPIAFAASSDPDTLYLHEAMRQPDPNSLSKPWRKKSGHGGRNQGS